MEWEKQESLISEFSAMIDTRFGGGLRGIIATVIPFEISVGDIWKKAGEIQQGFKEVRYPSKQERDSAWEKFNCLRNNLSKFCEEERESKSKKSEKFKWDILEKVKSAQPTTQLGLNTVDITEMKSLGSILKIAGSMLSEFKTEMLGEHKQECFDAIKNMREVHDAWWEDLKKEKENRKESYIGKIRRNLEANQERHRKATEALEYYKGRAEDLRDKINSAWNNEWAQTAEEKLSLIENKIEDIEKNLEQIEEWIKEDENKL